MIDWLSAVKLLNGILVHGKPISDPRIVTCRMELHNVTYHPTQVNAPRHSPSQTGRCSICLPWKKGWKAELTLVSVIYREGFAVHRPIQVVNTFDSNRTRSRTHNLTIASHLGVCVGVCVIACNCTPAVSSSSNTSTTSSLSGDCDRVTGQCYCQQNVIGDACDTCAPDAFNFTVSTGCQQCQCHTLGSVSQACDAVSSKKVNV